MFEYLCHHRCTLPLHILLDELFYVTSEFIVLNLILCLCICKCTLLDNFRRGFHRYVLRLICPYSGHLEDINIRLLINLEKGTQRSMLIHENGKIGNLNDFTRTTTFFTTLTTTWLVLSHLVGPRHTKSTPFRLSPNVTIHS